MKSNLWILESGNGKTPPGTCKLIIRHEVQEVTSNDDQEAKDVITTVLDPTPTKDPNDPLNWPRWQREFALAILVLASFVTNSGSGILSPAYVQLSVAFGRSFSAIANLSAYWQLALGLSIATLSPLARIWGKRHQYLLGLLLVFGGYIGSGRSKTYDGLLATRIIQGIGTACYEMIIGVSIGDLYYVHQRGSRLALSTLTVYAASFVSPIISGVVIENIGWRWVFHILAIMTGPIFILMFLFVPETTYSREEIYPYDTTADSNLGRKSENGNAEFHTNAPVDESISVPRISFVKRLLPIQKRASQNNSIMFWFRPFMLLFHPTVLWVLISSSASVFSIIFISIFIQTTFVGAPLKFNSSQIGLTSFAPLIGVVVGCIICASISDRSIKLLAKRNNGIYEPEFRLVLAIPQLILGFIGLYGFGVTAKNPEMYGWIWPLFFYALEMASISIHTMIGSAYLIDGYNNIILEAFIFLTISKNLIAFGIINSAVKWVEQTDTYRLFTILGVVQLSITLTTLLLYVFGRKIRAWTSTIYIFQEKST